MLRCCEDEDKPMKPGSPMILKKYAQTDGMSEWGKSKECVKKKSSRIEKTHPKRGRWLSVSSFVSLKEDLGLGWRETRVWADTLVPLHPNPLWNVDRTADGSPVRKHPLVSMNIRLPASEEDFRSIPAYDSIYNYRSKMETCKSKVRNCRMALPACVGLWSGRRRKSP